MIGFIDFNDRKCSNCHFCEPNFNLFWCQIHKKAVTHDYYCDNWDQKITREDMSEIERYYKNLSLDDLEDD